MARELFEQSVLPALTRSTGSVSVHTASGPAHGPGVQEQHQRPRRLTPSAGRRAVADDLRQTRRAPQRARRTCDARSVSFLSVRSVSPPSHNVHNQNHRGGKKQHPTPLPKLRGTGVGCKSVSVICGQKRASEPARSRPGQQPELQAFRNPSTSSVLTLPSPLKSAFSSPADQSLRNANTSSVLTSMSSL